MFSSDQIEKITFIIKNNFCDKRIIVIGDIMVDEYITGSVKRISPEAPVPVLDYRNRRLEAGGASNVAHNVKSLGAITSIIGVAANDKSGKWIREHFSELDINCDGIIEEEDRPTTIKTRFATKGQQLLRVDNEVKKGITKETQEKILDILNSRLEDVDAVILSDYNKGVFSDENFVQEIIKRCNQSGVLITIDSKSKNIQAFKGADFVKPNNLELANAVSMEVENDDDLNRAGELYLQYSGARALMVTKGAKGISIFRNGKEREDFAAKDVQVFDVCGAGDTVISTATLALTGGISIGDSARLANVAAGVVITKVGTVALTQEELLRGLNEK